MRKRGFTLIELIMVVTIIAIIGGIAVLSMQGVRREAEERLILSELSAVREAALRFKQDMGEPPQFLAELLQSPEQDPDADAADGMGGWWWRSDGNYSILNSDLPKLPEGHLCSYDPVTRRGWNGPYLQRELLNEWKNELKETRINPASAPDIQATIFSDADADPPKRVAILRSDYGIFPQATEEHPDDPIHRKISRCHYQLVFDDPDLPDEIIVRFQNNPTFTTPCTVKKIGTGIKP